jgi:pilus assembly protein CpaC
MQSKSMFLTRPFALAVGAALALGSISAPVDAAPRKKAKAKVVKVVKTTRPGVGIQRATGELYLAKGRGQLINLPTPIADVFVADPAIADVQVQSATQIYLFGKGDGETSVYATTRSGQVVYSTNVRVSQNYGSLDQVLRLAMPDSDITATLSGQVAVLTGTVKSPNDVAEAGDLVRAYLNPGTDVSDPKAVSKVMVINRLRTATPLQVTLQVRIAEVSRTFSKEIGVNLTNQQTTSGGAVFGIAQGRNPGTITVDPATGATDFKFTPSSTANATLSIGARLLGMNVIGALDAGEAEGFVTTLASPNLTALSGEKATFLAGGEFPIPITQSNGGALQTSVEFKPYGVTLEFVPTVMADGRISLVVKPEVSEIDFQNSVQVNGGRVPGLTSRRIETTVELGSGQSFVIGGLLKASQTNNFTKTPGVGDVPVLGALFRSNGWKRGETELMIVVTPYLVNPVAANKIILPTDGYKAPTELGRIFGGKLYEGTKTNQSNTPTVAPSITVPRESVTRSRGGTAPAPGFTN